MTTSDAIAIGAACLGAGLTVLAIVIAGASLWGFYNIKKSAKAVAQSTARAEVLALLDAGSEVGAKLREEMQSRIDKESDRLFQDFSMSGAFSSGAGKSEASPPIADKYPKEDS